MNLDLGNTSESEDAAAGLADAVAEAERVADMIVVPAHQRVKRKAKHDESLPAHLTRKEVVAEVSDDVQNCPIHGQRKLLPREMWKYIEKLMFSRPEMWVLRICYPQYACANSPECGLRSPKRPEGLVEGDKYDTSVASEIITGKYAYHMPFYRLQDYVEKETPEHQCSDVGVSRRGGAVEYLRFYGQSTSRRTGKFFSGVSWDTVGRLLAWIRGYFGSFER